MQGQNIKQKHWTQNLIYNLRKLQPKSQESGYHGAGNTKAFANIRNSVRGDTFVLKSLPYVVPYIPIGHNGNPLYVEEALLISQLYCLYPPSLQQKNISSSSTSRGKTIGYKLREMSKTTDTSENSKSDTSDSVQQPNASDERFLQTLITTDMTFLGKRLRGALQRIAKSNHPMTYEDFLQLAYDIAYWGREDKNIQKRWVSDFYRL